jgi:hypothetical protein
LPASASVQRNALCGTLMYVGVHHSVYSGTTRHALCTGLQRYPSNPCEITRLQSAKKRREPETAADRAQVTACKFRIELLPPGKCQLAVEIQKKTRQECTDYVLIDARPRVLSHLAISTCRCLADSPFAGLSNSALLPVISSLRLPADRLRRFTH